MNRFFPFISILLLLFMTACTAEQLPEVSESVPASGQNANKSPFQEIRFDIQYPESVEILAMDLDNAYIAYAGDTGKPLTGKERETYSHHTENAQYGTYNLKSGTISNYTDQFSQTIEVTDYYNGSSLLKDNKLYLVGMSELPVNLSLTPQPQPELSTYIYDFGERTAEKGYNYGSRGRTIAQMEWLNQDEYLVWMKAWDNSPQGIYRYHCKDDTAKPIVEFDAEDYVAAASFHGDTVWVYVAKPVSNIKYDHYLLGYDLDGNVKQRIALPKEITEYQSSYYSSYSPGYLVALDNNCFYIQDSSSQGSFIIQAQGDTSTVIADFNHEIDNFVYSRCNSFNDTKKDIFILDRWKDAIVRFEPDTLSLKALYLEKCNLPAIYKDEKKTSLRFHLTVGEDNGLILAVHPSSLNSEVSYQNIEAKYFYISPEIFEKESVEVTYPARSV